MNTAEENRNIGMAQVVSGQEEWRDEYRTAIAGLPNGFEGIGEDFRLAVKALGLRDPRHHNAWGAAFAGLIRSGWLEDTGRTATMKTPKSHARSNNKVYRLVNFLG